MASVGTATYRGLKRRLSATCSVSGTTLRWSITSSMDTSGSRPYTRAGLYVNGSLVYDSGYKSYSVWPGANGTKTGTVTVPATGDITYQIRGGVGHNNLTDLVGNVETIQRVFTPTINTPSVSPSRTTANASFSVANNGGQNIVDNYIECSKTNFGTVISTIKGTSGSFTGLIPNTTYYARANASNGKYRGYSSVRSFTTTGNAPIINSTSASPSRTNCTISHNTSYDTNASYKSISIKYGKTTSYGSTATSTSLSGLTPNTLYYYSVTITDNWNRTSAAKTGSFTTTGNPPVAEKIEVLDITRTSARLNMWGTYDTNAAWEEADYTYGVVEGEYTQTTGSAMENLEPNTTYYIKARFKDNWDRWSNYVYNSFTTIGNAPSNIIINLDNIGETNVELTVSAEPDTNAIIEEYAIYQDDSILVDYQTSPIFNINNLQEETEYNIVAKAKDNWDRIGISEVTTFTTLAGKWIKIINTNGETTIHKCYLITPTEKIEIKKDSFKILGG